MILQLPKHRSAENPSRSDFGPLELTDRTFSRPELSYVTAPGSWDSGSDQKLGIGSIEPILPLPPNLDGWTSPLDIVLIVNLDDITSYTLEHPVD
jgi:hypothetical protein